jgi:hypothetical protein
LNGGGSYDNLMLGLGTVGEGSIGGDNWGSIQEMISKLSLEVVSNITEQQFKRASIESIGEVKETDKTLPLTNQ